MRGPFVASCVVLGLCISRSPRHSFQTHATVSVVLHILKVIESFSLFRHSQLSNCISFPRSTFRWKLHVTYLGCYSKHSVGLQSSRGSRVCISSAVIYACFNSTVPLTLTNFLSMHEKYSTSWHF